MADRETLLSWRAVTPCSTVVSGFWGAEGPAPRTAAFRTYLEGAPGPGVYRFWTRNLRETTRGEGALRLADQPGGFWRVEEAFIADGGTRRDGAVYGTAVPVLFDGAPTRDVTPGEAFFSDAAAIDLPPGHDLAFSWTVTSLSGGPAIPCTDESILAAYMRPGGGASEPSPEGFAIDFNGRCALPGLFLRRAPSERIFAFLGDSVTQGYGTGEGRDAFWAARVIRRLPGGWNALNLGSGWARAYDAAADGAWLARAKAADEATVCLGVNDIGTCGRRAAEITRDLDRIVRLLKDANPGMRVWLFTLPPFDFGGAQLKTWRAVNDWIRAGEAPEAAVFDTVPVLGRDAPESHKVREEYRFALNPHPNARAGEALARAFLKRRG